MTFVIPDRQHAVPLGREPDRRRHPAAHHCGLLQEQDSAGIPGEDVFEALYVDLFIAEEQKLHTRLGTRLNYEQTGASSMFRKTGRAVGRFDTDTYTDAFTDADKAWEDPGHWAADRRRPCRRSFR